MDINKPPIVTQPHLGKVVENNGSDASGYLALAKVIRVHYKYAAADVMIINTNELITSDPVTTQGRFSARVGASQAHYDKVRSASSGVIEPLQEGQIVLLAFLEGNKNRPVILTSFHNTDSVLESILPEDYPLHPDNSIAQRKEALKYLRVFPSQAYHRVDGEGGAEISHPSKTFLKVDSDHENRMSDGHDTFDHDDLEEKDPTSLTTRFGHTEEALYPVKQLYVHRTSFDNTKTTWTKFFMDSTGMFRGTRDNNDGKLTYTEMSADGSYKIRRQNDSNQHGQGQQYTEVVINKDGGASITKVNGSKNSSVGITANDKIQLTHHTSSYMTFEDNGDIIIDAANHIVQRQRGV